MKILFLIGDPPIYAVSEWEEIKKYQKEGYYPTPTKEIYSLVKALEQNTELEKEILKARSNIGIPKEGIDWKKYRDSYNLTNLKKLSGKERETCLDLIGKVIKETIRIGKVLDLDYFVANQLRHLIYGNFVYFEYPQIIWYHSPASEFEEDAYPYDHLSIRISNRVAKNELINYIENNWKNISIAMNGLPPKLDLYISTRDQRIVALKDKNKLTFKEVATKIIEEYKIDDPEDKINYDSVRTAYRRAKDKIFSLTRTSKGNR